MEVTAPLEKERWFVATEAGTVEYPVDELQNAIAIGLVTQSSLVWREGMNEWLELAQVPPLALLLTSAASFTRARPPVANPALLRDEQAEDKTTVLNELPSPEPAASIDDRRLTEEDDEKTLLIDMRARRVFIQPLAPLQVPAIRTAVLSRPPARLAAPPAAPLSPAPAARSSNPPGTQTAQMPVATVGGGHNSARPAIERATAPRFTLNARPIVSVGAVHARRPNDMYRPLGLPDRPSPLPPSDHPSAAPSSNAPSAHLQQAAEADPSCDSELTTEFRAHQPQSFTRSTAVPPLQHVTAPDTARDSELTPEFRPQRPQHEPIPDTARDSALTPEFRPQQAQRAPTSNTARDSELTPEFRPQQAQRAPTSNTARDSELTPEFRPQQLQSLPRATAELPRRDPGVAAFSQASAPPTPQPTKSPSYVLSNAEPPPRLVPSSPAATTDIPLLITAPQARAASASPARNSKPDRARYPEGALGLVATSALPDATEHIASSSVSLPVAAPRARHKWVLGIAGSAVALAAVVGTLMSLRGAVAEVDSAHPSLSDTQIVSPPRATPVAISPPAVPADPASPSAASVQSAAIQLPQSSPLPSRSEVAVANGPRSPANNGPTREASKHREPTVNSAIAAVGNGDRGTKSDVTRLKGAPPAAGKAASRAASESSVAAWERGNAESRTWMQPGF